MRQSPRIRRVVQLAVAVLLAAIAAAVYRSSVVSRFEPIRIDVVSTELHASRHIVPITLPDLSSLRDQTVVLGLRLRNTRSEQRQIGLLGDGLPRNRTGLAPGETLQWDVVLSPEVVRALDTRVAGATRTLELTGDADGWALTALEVRNYHVRVGGRLLLVLPRAADAYTPASGRLPVALALMLVALMAAFAPRPERRSFRRATNGLAVVALLVCTACLLVPRLWPYRVMFSPLAFAFVVTALFSPAHTHVPALLRRSAIGMAAISRQMSAVWQRHDLTFERGAVLLGLGALAIAQPIFDVVSNSPEFFAARGTTAATALTAVAIICFGVPVALLVIERAIRLADGRAAAVFHALAVALLAAAVAMPWFRRGQLVASPWDVIASGSAGVALALASANVRVVRQFLTALSPAALVVPALFLLDTTVRQSLLPSESAAAVQSVERTPPIVFVVFDELPLNSLLAADGTIDAVRYPNFASLARDAYWFRNASTVASNTAQAVPAILSGRYPTAVNDLPTLQYYPVNLFTTLARHYSIFASLRFQKLCPPRACQDNAALPADTVGSLLSDLGLVWLHIVLPESAADGLPPVTDDWAEFGETREAQAGDVRNTRGGTFAQFLSAIDGQPARLHFIHSMLPHMPFEYVPSGRRYRRPEDETRLFRRSRLFEAASASYADTLHQRHLAQVGFVDRLIGDLVARLRETGVYDQALVVITADHGASYREGRSRRRPQPQRNLAEILRVPLLVKLPGQQGGEVRDEIAETVDILPTILDVVGVRASLRFDGRSLVDESTPARTLRTFVWRNRSNVSLRALDDTPADRAESLRRKERRFGRGDPAALYAPGGARHLLGLNVSDAPVQPVRDVKATLRNVEQFEAVSLTRDPLPLYVAGTLATSRAAPLTVAVTVNGVVAAVTQSYQEQDAHAFATLIPETSLREGHNVVAALVVDGSTLNRD